MVDTRVSLKSIVETSHESAEDNPSTINTGRLTRRQVIDSGKEYVITQIVRKLIGAKLGERLITLVRKRDGKDISEVWNSGSIVW
jgi:hypothetical protein